MEKSVATKYKVRKFLKIFSFLLLFLLFALIIWGYVRIIPQDIKYSNVTSSSFTVSWNTKFPTKGTAVLIEANNKLPVSLAIFEDNNWYDSRDVKRAELESTARTADNVLKNGSFGVSIQDFVTERVISEKGNYYTHHIEITGLDPEKQYGIMIGDAIMSFNTSLFSNTPTVTTTAVPKEIDVPVPVYGQIKDAKNESKDMNKLATLTDAVVYFNYLDETTGEKSNVFSSTLNSEGSWYIDASLATDKDGENFLDKYSSTITNILGEIVIDAGTLGTWKKTINMHESAPVETIVLNAPDVSQDQSNPYILRRIDSAVSDNGIVKGANAMEGGCFWISYCGCGKKEKEKWVDCACDEDTLKARGCAGQQSAQEAVSSLDSTQCAGGKAPGSHEVYAGVCKECKSYKSYYTWQNVDMSLCTNGGNGGQGDGKRVNINPGQTCNDPDGCTCNSSDQYIPGSGTQASNPISISIGAQCTENSSQTGQGDGVKSNKNAGERCDDTDGCNCIDSMQSSVNYNQVCIAGVADLETAECWENIASMKLYRDNGDQKEVCKNNKWQPIGFLSTYTGCKTEEPCSGNFRCVKDNIIYSCSSSIADGNKFTLVPVTNENKAGEMRSAIEVPIRSAGEKCMDGPCLCTDGPMKNKLIDTNQYCLQVTNCYDGNEGLICDLDGKKCSDQYDTENSSYKCNASLLTSPIKKVFAAEDTAKESKKYIIDPQTGYISGIQEGMYIFQNEGKTYMFTVESKDLEVNGGKILVFIDKNSDGVYNEGSDIKISELASQITINAVKEKYSYSLKQGFNFVNFPFLVDNSESRTAAGLLKTLNEVYGDSIYSISKYDGKWKIVGQNATVYDTNDFQLVPGQGYIIKAKKNIDISIVGQPVLFETDSDKAPITLYQGWNLVGTYGTNVKQYTAKTLIEGINNFKAIDFTADNVSRWESDVQRYDGLQITNQNGIDITYGFDFPINSQQAYFVRILQGKGNWQLELEK